MGDETIVLHAFLPAFFILLVVSPGLAAWKGGEPERLGGLVILAMWGLQSFGEYFLPSRFSTVDPVAFCSDLVGTLGFGFIALHARRVWPLWAASLQLLSLSAHFARWADIGIPKIVYALMRGGPTFVVMLVLLAGTLAHWRRMRRVAVDHPWQSWRTGSGKSGC
ncbi:hypothetical protein MTR62_14160 [Novosphingobium sp. 1949]|uniref:Uncharacterized protein n=1 Tax=Novosphingobium organovorum TaxID=2930092 RepID=A0ABT0BG46_9SPHN|nr:hypothetical protein [Novosphingobium organovorum]MCJ2183828.1 hypothetical protein [Novosphingobium organovorum]